MPDPIGLRSASGYSPIEQYGLIGNMRTAALVATDGSLDYMCWPEFDFPSLFCRILDNERGGSFKISPENSTATLTTKQQYLPSSNILQTMFYSDEGVMRLVDFFPRVEQRGLTDQGHNIDVAQPLKKWLVRHVECVRGEVDVHVNVLPAFNHARDDHLISILESTTDGAGQTRQTAVFGTASQEIILTACLDGCDESADDPQLSFYQAEGSSLGIAVAARLRLKENQKVSFVLRDSPEENDSHQITAEVLDRLQEQTKKFWFDWISQSKYNGRWQEVIQRSLLTLKLLTFEPTGAIVAAPTFSLPEAIGGGRNWDYRYCWVRDASFTIYIFLRMGFKQEAEAYMTFMKNRFKQNRTEDGGIPIMFSIHGKTDLPETELSHLSGYKDSRPVRIGNGAAFHKQLDIYSELMDAIYLYNKYGKPVSYDDWRSVREITNFVCKIWQEKDQSIWEVRGQAENFTYSKIMLWVAVDRALRLSDKRCFPCPSRMKWLQTRDEIMESVMDKGYNQQMLCFIQSYENTEAVDSAVLIALLVFFIAPNDERSTHTLDKILQPLEKGGLTSAGMVYRYNTSLSDDGVGGDEGAFSLCTFWLVEALTRAGAYDRKYLELAVTMFENILGFANHVGLFSEEIAKTGEQLGNTPQAFSHLAMISAAFNLDRVIKGEWRLGQ